MAPGIGYLHEPFSQMRRPGWTGEVFRHWYPYVSAENEATFVEPLERLLRFEFPIRSQLKSIKTKRLALRTIRDYTLSVIYRMSNSRPLIRDPFATFMTPWLHERFDADVVLMVRHPLGFVGSLKARGFDFDFSHWTSQPLLLANLASEQAEEIRSAARDRPDVIDQGILLWKVIYDVVGRYHARFPSWQVVRVEDLSRSPVEGSSSCMRNSTFPGPTRLRERSPAIQQLNGSLRLLTASRATAAWSPTSGELGCPRPIPSASESASETLRGSSMAMIHGLPHRPSPQCKEPREADR